MDTLVNLISQVGFPIAAFCAMWYLNLKTTEAITELSETVAKNTEAIDEIKNYIKGE